MTLDESTDVVDNAVAVLMEHFDNVQIFVSWLNEERGTSSLHRGAGNWMARVGQCQDFINSNNNYELARAIAEHLNDGDEDGEEWKAAI